jgi:hypothetical protein
MPGLDPAQNPHLDLEVDTAAALLGLPQEVADKAKQLLRDGQECDRCGFLSKGDDLNNMFAMTASTPRMPTPSPPSMLCQRCGYLTAAFMGVNAAKEVCERNGWS